MGPRDAKPTSTMIVRTLARHRAAVLPPGGIPIVDARLLAMAHRRALVAGGSGTRYAVVGPYLSYRELAAVVASIAGRPRRVIALPDRWEPALGRAADWTAPLVRRWIPDLSRQLVAGAFLRLHVHGRARRSSASDCAIRPRPSRSRRAFREVVAAPRSLKASRSAEGRRGRHRP